MQTGRPSSRPRTPFGARLHQKREAARLSQAQVAERVGLSQRAYAAWEREPVAIQPDKLALLAEILGTTVAELMGEEQPKRATTPAAGRLRQSFETVAKLPRRQQAKILDVVEALLSQQRLAS
jgi:transcriptional regulator with XRE-family HTH domain